jgi:hypothetical protein
VTLTQEEAGPVVDDEATRQLPRAAHLPSWAFPTAARLVCLTWAACVWAGRRAEAGRGQDAADRAGADTVAEPEEFALDAPMAPSRVFLCEADDQVADVRGDRWPAGSGRSTSWR